MQQDALFSAPLQFVHLERQGSLRQSNTMQKTYLFIREDNLVGALPKNARVIYSCMEHINRTVWSV